MALKYILSWTRGSLTKIVNRWFRLALGLGSTEIRKDVKTANAIEQIECEIMHTQDLHRHGWLRVGNCHLLGIALNSYRARCARMASGLALGVATLLASTVAHGTPMLTVEFPPGGFVTLAGGQSVSVFNGPAAGSVNHIDISFYFDPATEGAQADSRASDFSLIVIAPGGEPQQWGGADVPFQALYPGANHVANWSFHGPGSGGPGNFQKTYGDTQTMAPGLLAGIGNWQILIMNGYDASQAVNYVDVKIVLSGITTPNVPEGFGSGESMLCLAGLTGLMGLVRSRARTI